MEADYKSCERETVKKLSGFREHLQNMEEVRKFMEDLASQIELKNTGGILSVITPKKIPVVPGGWKIKLNARGGVRFSRELHPDTREIIGSVENTQVFLVTRVKGDRVEVALVEGKTKEGGHYEQTNPSLPSYKLSDLDVQIEGDFVKNNPDLPPNAVEELSKVIEDHPEILPPAFFSLYLKSVKSTDVGEVQPVISDIGEPEDLASLEDVETIPEFPELGRVPERWAKEPLYTVYTKAHAPLLKKIRKIRAQQGELHTIIESGEASEEQLQQYEIGAEENKRLDVEMFELSVEMDLAWLSAYPITFSPSDIESISDVGFGDSQDALDEFANGILRHNSNEKGGIINGPESYFGSSYIGGARGGDVVRYAKSLKRVIKTMEDRGETTQLNFFDSFALTIVDHVFAHEEENPLDTEQQEVLRGERTPLSSRSSYLWEGDGSLYMSELELEAFKTDAHKMRKRIAALTMKSFNLNAHTMGRRTELEMQRNPELANEVRTLSKYYLSEMQEEQGRLTNNVLSGWLERFPLPSLSSEEIESIQAQMGGRNKLERINTLGDDIRYAEILRRRQIKEIYASGDSESDVVIALEEPDRALAVKVVQRNYLVSQLRNVSPGEIVDEEYHRVFLDALE